MKTKKWIIRVASGITTISASSAIVACSSKSNKTINDGTSPENQSNPGNPGNQSDPGNPGNPGNQSNTGNPDKDKNIKVGSWNIANFNNSSKYFDSRVMRLSKIINDAELDILAVQEIDSLAAIYKLAKELNYINKTANEWKVVASDWAWKAKKNNQSDPEYMGSTSAREYYGFIYKSSKVKPKAFSDGKIGEFYDNPWKDNEFLKAYNDNSANSNKIPSIRSAYVRPPFGVMFDVVGKNKDFTLITSHFDSPGVSGAKANEFKNKNHFTSYSKDPNIKNKGKTAQDTFELASASGKKLNDFYSGAGSQEIFEAQNLKYVMEYFMEKSGANNDLIFMGDTNIKALDSKKSRVNPFQSTIDAGYIEAFDPSAEESKTTLGKSDYASPYDRFYYKDDEVVKDSAKKYPLSKVYERSQYAPPVLNASNDKAVKGKTIDNNLIKKLTSDHTLVYLEIDSSKTDSDIASTSVGEQTSREIDVNKASFWDLLTKAGINKKIVYKILYYRNLVGKIDQNIMENLVKYMYQSKLTGDLSKIEKATNIKFTYNSNSTKKSKEDYFEETAYKTLIPKELEIKKIDINQSTIEILDELKNKGLIDEAGYKAIIDKRDAKVQIKNLNDIGLNNSYLKDLYVNLFDFSSQPTALPANPYKINVSSVKAMIDSLTGGKKKPLYTYSVYAIVAHRILVGPIKDQQELENIIGSYGASKMAARVNFNNSKPDNNDPVANMLKKGQKININGAPNTIIEKVFGTRTGGNIIANLEKVKKQQIANSNAQPGSTINIDGARSFDDIKGSYKPERYKSSFDEIFTFASISVDVPNKTSPPTNPQSNTFNIANLIAWAKGNGGQTDFMNKLKQFGIVGTNSKGNEIIIDPKKNKNKMSKTQTRIVFEALKGANPATVTNFTKLIDLFQNKHKYSVTGSAFKRYEIFKALLPSVEQV